MQPSKRSLVKTTIVHYSRECLRGPVFEQQSSEYVGSVFGSDLVRDDHLFHHLMCDAGQRPLVQVQQYDTCPHTPLSSSRPISTHLISRSRIWLTALSWASMFKTHPEANVRWGRRLYLGVFWDTLYLLIQGCMRMCVCSPCEMVRRSSRRLRNDSEATCGLPQRSVSSSTSSSNLIQRAVSLHCISWFLSITSSFSSTNTWEGAHTNHIQIHIPQGWQ